MLQLARFCRDPYHRQEYRLFYLGKADKAITRQYVDARKVSRTILKPKRNGSEGGIRLWLR